MAHLHVILGYYPKEINVVVRVEACHVLTADGLRPKHLHLAVQAVVHDQVVGHAHAVRLHGVPLPVVVIPDLGCGADSDGNRTSGAEHQQLRMQGSERTAWLGGDDERPTNAKQPTHQQPPSGS